MHLHGNIPYINAKQKMSEEKKMSEKKRWGKREFWGVDYDYDPQWILTEDQKQLQKDLIELCRTTLRPNAIISDETYEYPRKNLDALASMGLLGLIVPKYLGGRGASHRCAAMVVETIARYGCPSTALVYVMHIGACAGLLFRYHNNPKLKDLLSRLNTERLVGTFSYSDPATGGHFWYPLSSKCWKMADGRYKTLKFASWTTSAGFADWYFTQTCSPGFDGDYSNLSNFLFFKEEIRANTDEWCSLGMRGNQSGPMVSEALLDENRLIGPIGDGSRSNDEIEDPFFLLLSSCCWNGIAMGSIDIAKKHVTSKGHADVGLRVCDYPTIQDYFGEKMTKTNACRLMAFSLAGGMDEATGNNDWSIHSDLDVLPRYGFLHWLWQLKFAAADNVTKVTDKMLHACGGSGYKTDLGLERLLRDGKASWVMGPSNEVLRQFVGKSVLMGQDILDYWHQKVDERNLNSELKRLTRDQKSTLAKKLLHELSLEDGSEGNIQENDTDFDNPFNTKPPRETGETEAALSPNADAVLKVKRIEPLTKDGKFAKILFDLPPKGNHLGTLPGQYIQIMVPGDETKDGRYISPTSPPTQSGELEIAVRYENQGILAKFLKGLNIGQAVEFRGPCGGFEYEPNKLSHLILICSGIGVTPAIQIIRSLVQDKTDKTQVTLLYQARDREQLFFKTEFDGYSADDRVKVFYTLQDPDGDWSGNEGQIGKAFIETNLSGSNEGKRKVLICGGALMITCTLHGLFELRFRSDEIFVYGQFGAEQVRAVFGRKARLSAHLAE